MGYDTHATLVEWFAARYDEPAYRKHRDAGHLTAEALRADVERVVDDYGLPDPDSTRALVQEMLYAVVSTADWDGVLSDLDDRFGYDAE